MRKTLRTNYHQELLAQEQQQIADQAQGMTKQIATQARQQYQKYIERLNQKAMQAETNVINMYDQFALDLNQQTQETLTKYKRDINEYKSTSVPSEQPNPINMDHTQQGKQTIREEVDKAIKEVTDHIANATTQIQNSVNRQAQQIDTKVQHNLRDFDHQLKQKLLLRELEAKRKEKEWYKNIQHDIDDTITQIKQIRNEIATKGPPMAQTTIPNHFQSFRGQPVDTSKPIPNIRNPYSKKTSQNNNHQYGHNNQYYDHRQQNPEDNKFSYGQTTQSEQLPNPDLDNRLYRFKKDELYAYADKIPTQPQMESIYRTISSSMNSFDLPIRSIMELQPRGCTLPATYNYTQEQIVRISETLYQKLLKTIPPDCTDLHTIINNYSGTQDGYKALYAMMRNTCSYLHDVKPTWGPQWTADKNAHAYHSDLNSFLTQAARLRNTYTQFDIAAEILQQAKTIPRYHALALAQMAQLYALPSNQTQVPAELQKENLITNLEINHKHTIPNNPTINKVGQQQLNAQNQRGPRRRHQYKNPVQCLACHQFGHNIGDQVCRYTGQLYHAMAYMDQNPESTKANADAYHLANSTSKVNKIMQQFPEQFHEHMDLDEQEDTRCELAGTFILEPNRQE